MSDTDPTTRPIAVLGIDNKPIHVPDAIIEAKKALGKLRNSGDLVVPLLILDQQDIHAATLLAAQEAMGTTDSATGIRNIAYGVVFLDHQSNMLSLQIRANQIVDLTAAANFIKNNGYALKKEHGVLSNPDISIKNKEDMAGTIHAEIKAPDTNKQFSIDWDYSYDNGVTWQHAYSTGVCDRDIPNLKSGASVMVRARINIGHDGPTDWMVSNTITVA